MPSGNNFRPASDRAKLMAAAVNADSTDSLARYWAKRDFAITAEPRGERLLDRTDAPVFVVQKHAASRLHYDFRLELDGVLVSWAVPKGPSLDPMDKRMAIHVENHPLSYAAFEGTIPPKQYGAGQVIVWDHGVWEPVGDPQQSLKVGKMLFHLHGQKLQGLWELVKIAKGGEKQEPWILFKKRDAFARPKTQYDVVIALPDSVISKPLTNESAATKRASAAAPLAIVSATRRARAAKPLVAAKLAGAVKAKLPDTLSPQLATLASSVPDSGKWIFEIKFDGYRLMTRIEGGKARLMTRGGHDWSSKMPDLVKEIEQLGIHSGYLDGEIVVMGPTGVPDFGALQKAFDSSRAQAQRIDYFLFDMPFFEGFDLRAVSQRERRQLLKALLEAKATTHVRFSADFEVDAATILASACRMNLEGVMAKRVDAPYTSRRSDTWLKLKCKLRQEFVVCGYTERSDNAAAVGSLLLGIHSAEGTLISAGSVGTGWSIDEAQELKLKLKPLTVAKPPFPAGASKLGRWSKRSPGAERWVKPALVVEVTFAEWTADSQIRHASVLSLRMDKSASAIVRETASDFAVASVTETRRRAAPMANAIKVTHGERVIDPRSGLTKLDLVRYYETVAEFILPHLKGRPTSLVRGPQGIAGQLFFQKHGEKIGIPGIVELDASLWPGHASLLEVAGAQSLAGAAQLNVIEFHTWNSTKKAIDKPDRMIFDLDPGEGTSWEHIQEAALLTHAMLKELGLQAWLKTSGGKGLHIVVPLAARLDYETVGAFSKAIVQHLAKTVPSRFVAKSGPSNRVGKLFVDYLRNGHGATTAAAFSARARPGLGVSMPVAWDDLASLKSGSQWTVATAREHLSFQQVDPWAGYWKRKQTLGSAMRILGYKA